MSAMSSLRIEGYTSEEILALPPEHFDRFILTGEPLALRAGSAEILVAFCICDNRLVAEFGHIDGGGEGVFLTFWLLTKQYAQQRGLDALEWIVHAVTCAQPNLKLRRVLLRRGFVVEEVAGIGLAYHYVHWLQ